MHFQDALVFRPLRPFVRISRPAFLVLLRWTESTTAPVFLAISWRLHPRRNDNGVDEWRDICCKLLSY